MIKFNKEKIKQKLLAAQLAKEIGLTKKDGAVWIGEDSFIVRLNPTSKLTEKDVPTSIGEYPVKVIVNTHIGGNHG